MNLNSSNKNNLYSALILSAGYSSRMAKGIKALLPFSKHKCMIFACIDTCLQSGIENIIIIVGYKKEEIIQAVKAEYAHLNSITFVENKNFDSGMFSSIQTGFKALFEREEKFEACFLFPVDNALTKYTTLKQLITEFETNSSNNILIPYFENKSGHPPLIGKEHFKAITEYSGENGLRGYFALFTENARVDVIDEGILSDIDTDSEHDKALNFLDFTINKELLSIKECLALMHKENLPEKVIKHSLKVALASFRLALAINKNEIKPQFALIAGLLHDIKKLEENHPIAGEELLNSMGYKALSCPIATHMNMDKTVLNKMGIDYTDIENFTNLINNKYIDDINCFCSCVCVYIADRYYVGFEYVNPIERFNRVRERYQNDIEALEAINQREALANRIIDWYNNTAGVLAEDIVNKPTNHIYEQELLEIFSQYA